ncbi:L-fucose permease [Anaerohalosphaera lusitana]|uniref:L-fucose permease n=1 Tax=Anaerohalosphaera lusitana TaxID=1936003 RepID=A0A1U9NL42_9BACT|nr:MFS transporter [Anaerohalosphaera lusitana]AQT68651.1 L-fucose permease [Anaerohalosphaera lusitana]
MAENSSAARVSSSYNNKPTEEPKVVPRHLLAPFILVTLLFALWGFANDITNPLVKAFKDVFVISNTQSSFVQMAFYGGYATMALPAALFIRRFSYKSGIIVGLALYATGALLSIPAASMVNFNLFLVALYVLTFGLAFLETTANPYILSMGPEKTATQRLNLAQAFNPIGSLTGMTVAILAILGSLQVQDFRDDVSQWRAERAAQFRSQDQATANSGALVDSIMELLNLDQDDGKPVDPKLEEYLDNLEADRNKPLDSELAAKLQLGEIDIDPEAASLADIRYDSVLTKALKAYKTGEIETFRGKPHKKMQVQDLKVVRAPYVAIGLLVLVVLMVFAFMKMPKTGGHHKRLHLKETFGSLLRNKQYLEGVVAQTFYVGAQIMCWTFIIHYATDLLGFTFAKAQAYNIIAMIIFCSSRFICTFLLKFFSPGRLLMTLSIGAMGLTLGAIFLSGMIGLYCLVGISACMSLMFPTIYGIALEGMGDEAKIASAGLIFAIVGGALMPPLQGRVIDLGMVGGLEAVRASFFVPFVSFVVIALYGLRTWKLHQAPTLEKV